MIQTASELRRAKVCIASPETGMEDLDERLILAQIRMPLLPGSQDRAHSQITHQLVSGIDGIQFGGLAAEERVRQLHRGHEPKPYDQADFGSFEGGPRGR